MKDGKADDVRSLQYFTVSFICNDTKYNLFVPSLEATSFKQNFSPTGNQIFLQNTILKGGDREYVVGSVILIWEGGGAKC